MTMVYHISNLKHAHVYACNLYKTSEDYARHIHDMLQHDRHTAARALHIAYINAIPILNFLKQLINNTIGWNTTYGLTILKDNTLVVSAGNT